MYDPLLQMCVDSSISAVKYLYKYVYKGHDRASISLERDASEIINEPKEYLDARYVSASEACWRIFGFPMHHHQPYVI